MALRRALQISAAPPKTSRNFGKVSFLSSATSIKPSPIATQRFLRLSAFCSAGYGHVTEEVVASLTEAVGGRENVSTSQAVREQHGQDESYHSSLPADVVVFPHSVDHVTSVAHLCHTHHIPLVPFGTGTGLEGGVGAVEAC